MGFFVGRVAQLVQRLATGWTVQRSNPGGGEIFRTCPDRAWWPTQPPVQWVLGLAGGKERPWRDADHSPPSSAMGKKEQIYTSTPPMGCTACTEPQCLYKGAPYLYLTAILQHTSCYMFRPSLVHRQGAQYCTEQLFNIVCCSRAAERFFLYNIYVLDLVAPHPIMCG